MRPQRHLPQQQPAPALQNNKRVLDDGATGDLKRQKLVHTKALDAPSQARAVQLEIRTIPVGGLINQNAALNQHPDYDRGLLHARVGQPVRLMVRAVGQQVQLGNVQWAVGGAAVGPCGQDLQQGTAPALTAAALGVVSITIIWISPGTHTVTVTANVGAASGTCTARVKVIAPSVDAFTYSTAHVSLCGDGEYGRQPGSFLALYDRAPERYGCTWNATVSTVEEGVRQQAFATTGRVGFIQVCCFDSAELVANPSGEGLARDGTYVDDTTNGYFTSERTALDASPNQMLYCPPKQLNRHGTVAFGPRDGGQDSPATRLNAGIVRVTENNMFRTHLVYKCNIANSIWVTLAYADWSWEARTCRQGWEWETGQGGGQRGDERPERPTGGAWQPPTGVRVVPAPHQVTQGNLAPHGGPANDMPTWNQRVDELLIARKVKLAGT